MFLNAPFKIKSVSKAGISDVSREKSRVTTGRTTNFENFTGR